MTKNKVRMSPTVDKKIKEIHEFNSDSSGRKALENQAYRIMFDDRELLDNIREKEYHIRLLKKEENRQKQIYKSIHDDLLKEEKELSELKKKFENTKDEEMLNTKKMQNALHDFTVNIIQKVSSREDSNKWGNPKKSPFEVQKICNKHGVSPLLLAKKLERNNLDINDYIRNHDW